VKKGRHRRFEEARALKRITLQPSATPCDECGASAEAPCASWCLARVPEDDFEEPDDAYGADNSHEAHELDDLEAEFADSELNDAPNEAANY
jgi:hypothetical protein